MSMDTPNLPAAVAAEQTHMCLPSQPDWIQATVEFLRQKAQLCGACQETRSGKLMVALHEAISNAVVHGNLELSSQLKEQGDSAFAEALAARAADSHYADRIVEILVDYNGDRCQWRITDQGNGFDVERALKKLTSDDPELLLASGRGIIIMHSFLDEVKYEAGGRRVILTLRKSSGTEKRHEERVTMQRPLRVAPIRADASRKQR